jgi:hypothetical protein
MWVERMADKLAWEDRAALETRVRAPMTKPTRRPRARIILLAAEAGAAPRPRFSESCGECARTAYLRADTIAEPQRGELKAAPKEYIADRVELLSGKNRDSPR